VSVRPLAAVRAGSTQDTVNYLEEFRPGLFSRVESAITPGHIERIRSYSRMAWLPLDEDVIFAEAAYAAIGPRSAHTFWTEFINKQLEEAAILRAAVGSAMRLFDMDPGSLLRWVPKILPLVYRDIVDASVLHKPHEAIVIYANADERFMSREVYLTVVRSQVRAVLQLAKCPEGTADVTTDAKRSRIEVAVRW
jgi:hypothetical protein